MLSPDEVEFIRASVPLPRVPFANPGPDQKRFQSEALVECVAVIESAPTIRAGLEELRRWAAELLDKVEESDRNLHRYHLPNPPPDPGDDATPMENLEYFRQLFEAGGGKLMTARVELWYPLCRAALIRRVVLAVESYGTRALEHIAQVEVAGKEGRRLLTNGGRAGSGGAPVVEVQDIQAQLDARSPYRPHYGWIRAKYEEVRPDFKSNSAAYGKVKELFDQEHGERLREAFGKEMLISTSTIRRALGEIK